MGEKVKDTLEAGKKYLKRKFRAELDRGARRFCVMPSLKEIPAYIDDNLFSTSEISVEDSVDIHMREVDFVHLMELMGYFSEIDPNLENYYRDRVQEQIREEKLREKYPAVQKAYEHYLLMLKMVEDGKS